MPWKRIPAYIAGVQWSTPVAVRIGYGSPEMIENAADALEFLERRWPHERDKQYQAAKQACEGALFHSRSSSIAREAFIAAAIEAYVLA
ncbi:DUF982 domain-containing protein [Neorhizobium galegae]|uniref:DUF982 domain-containing protein n=1 Tax=Neorhizobium galegae TaxID=399 RepID=UPI000621735F|nr:DUF982 domain-containing protein [Neorhizobium galegae]UIK08178.1 DUF982 domain-containing protein [Neorhizobium galegae]CDZ73512.1 Hypothetical protein NGAL_HAMBI2610_51440 [Neorhizobium galegae bv. orientalis]